jgi:hypothetical protein
LIIDADAHVVDHDVRNVRVREANDGNGENQCREDDENCGHASPSARRAESC